MARCIVFSMISLDGVMQAPGGPGEDPSGDFAYGGWVAPYSDEQYGAIVREEMRPARYLLGASTFRMWENYWPEHKEFWPAITTGTKYVFSRSLNSSTWENSVFLHTRQELISLLKADGPDIHVWGSSELVHILLEEDLVDELRLKIHPLILANGKKLFSTKAKANSYRLERSITTSTGVIIATYRRTGAVKTGQISI